MKPFILLLIAVVPFVACKKAAKVSPQKITSPITVPTSNPITTEIPDTLATNAGVKIQIAKDSVNTDETMLLFYKSANPGYDPMEDARYFAGGGKVSIASICDDGTEMAISRLPYTPGKIIPLFVAAKTDGQYLLKISYEKSFPADKRVWLRDTYLKDSIDLRTGNYPFDLTKADTNTFGSSRFKLVIKTGNGQQSINLH
ncbi:hypothetical protein [Mucilaginibacter ginsenosidivorans]|uniref:Uncharacterized protein n=1 Tax=Mucilaginibacter ginsenosidivorans TaxID=398053 RepID=A0A5B8URX9_9SPHI|nr:hypothetical protein [Mucilaginibacter ginsenosidivorans]QEC61833.1 hypothetical protein FRZ54_04275 [Mucilaginibacter ginsenosidivorans]